MFNFNILDKKTHKWKINYFIIIIKKQGTLFNEMVAILNRRALIIIWL